MDMGRQKKRDECSRREKRETGKQGIRQRPTRPETELHWRTFRTMEHRQSSVYMQYIYVWMYVCVYGYTYIRMYTSTHNCMCIYLYRALAYILLLLVLFGQRALYVVYTVRLTNWPTGETKFRFIFMQRRGQWKLSEVGSFLCVYFILSFAKPFNNNDNNRH